MKKSPIFLSVLLLLGLAVAAQEKPNILWITIEDTSAQFIGCYDNVDARTPVIDRLASEGVRFNHAFSTGTVCSPSRSCIITGVKTYKTGTGNHRSNYPVPEFIKGFPYYLQKNGYYTTNNNKTDYNVANAKAFTNEAWDESSGKAGWWNRNPGQPFFAVFNFMSSHQSRTMTEPYPWYNEHVLSKLGEGERIGDQEITMPPFYLDSPEMRRQFARVYNSIKLTDQEIGELLDRLEKDNLKDSTIIFFFADHGEGIPRGKTNGINLGYRVPFVIWFPEKYKHLSPWGTGGVMTDELVDFTDLAPTIVSLTGGQVPDYMQGRVLLGERRSSQAKQLFLSADRSDNGIDLVRSVTNGRFFYSRNFMPFMPEARYIRYMEISEIKRQMRSDLANNRLSALQKSIFEKRPAEYLFDIENDPWETTNLAADPAYAEILEEMRSALKRELTSSRDVLLLPEYEIGRISKTETPYEYRLNDKKYPVNEVVDAALLAGIRSKVVAKQQVEMLSDTNCFVRYWAILGLCSQNREIQHKYASDIIQAMNDSYPPVAITAAAVAYGTLGSEVAREQLKISITGENEDISLMVINYLLYVEKKEPFVETVKMVWKQQSRGYNVRAACADFLGSLGLIPNNPDYGE